MGHKEMPEWERVGAKTLAVGGGAALVALPMLIVSAGFAFMVGMAVGKLVGKKMCMHGMRSPWGHKMGMGMGMGMGGHHHHGYGQPPCGEMHGKHMGMGGQMAEHQKQEPPMGM